MFPDMSDSPDRGAGLHRNGAMSPSRMTNDLDDIDFQVAIAERKRSLRRTAAGLAAAGVITVAAFVGEMIAGSVSTVDTLSLLFGLVSAYGAFTLWRESRNPQLPDEDGNVPGTEATAIASTLRLFSSFFLIAGLWPAMRGGDVNPVWLAVAVAFLGLSFIRVRERKDPEDRRD